jgi:ABC-type hemin transport system substrate-binding protein
MTTVGEVDDALAEVGQRLGRVAEPFAVGVELGEGLVDQVFAGLALPHQEAAQPEEPGVVLFVAAHDGGTTVVGGGRHEAHQPQGCLFLHRAPRSVRHHHPV